jgi:hypothetical protein
LAVHSRCKVRSRSDICWSDFLCNPCHTGICNFA